MPTFVDWAPNPHALVVHLPIGLLVTTIAVDLLALARRDACTVVIVSTGLYVARTATLVATADLGGRLVYEHGVGVAAPAAPDLPADSPNGSRD